MAEINMEKMVHDVAQKAIQELRNNGVFVSRWISVSERLPEAGIYLICTDDGYITTIMYDRSMGWLLNSNIVAWMPLPEPYRAESEISDADSN